MLISRKRNRMNYPSCYNQQWSNTGNCPYLLLSSDLSWTNNIERICPIAKKILGLLYHQFYQHADQETLTLQLYIYPIVWPHMEYAAPVWDPHMRKDQDLLERTQSLCVK